MRKRSLLPRPAARVCGVTWGVAVALLVIAAAPARAVEVQRVVSPGGIEAWLVEDHQTPIITLELAIRGGAALDPAGKEGLAQMVSSVIDEGAGDLDSQAFQGRLDDLSITLGFDGFLDTFRGSLRTLTRNHAEAFDLMRLALTEPRFDAEPVERIRSQIQTILARRLNDPDTIASNTFWAAVFPDHPYGRPRRGTAESVAAITTTDLRGSVAARFARDTLTLGVVGDITADALAPLLDQTFGSLPRAGQPFHVPEVSAGAAGEVIVVAQDVPQSTVVFGQPGLKRADPDYYAAYVLNHVLGGGSFTSRLYQEVREERGLAYSVYSYLNPLDHAAMWMGGVGTDNATVGQSLGIIREEWRRIRDDGVSAAELTDAKTNLTGGFALRFSDSRSIARTLVGMQLEDLGIDYIDRRNGFIEAVGSADLERVARRFLDPDALTVVVVGRPEGVAPTSAQGGG